MEGTERRPGLGRIAAPDDRDKNFALRTVRALPEGSRYWYSGGWWGDQGPFPHCVGFAWVHWLEDGPVAQVGPAPIVSPAELYRAAQRVDEWPGESYDGTSVRAGAKVLQSRGFISEYRWAFDLRTLVHTLLTTGPVVFGSNWYEGMDNTSPSGFVKVEGDMIGGHAYLLNGVNTKRRVIRAKQSWGRSWGKAGYFNLTFDDVERLIHEEGEACLALEVKKEKTR